MTQLQDLTTAQVAGFIAAGIFAVQILFKLLWPLILIGLLHTSDSAVTWSVVARNLHSSLWPTILRADSSATAGVRSSVTVTTKLATLAGILVSLASIITPLGLYEAILPGKETQQVEFQYAQDPSVFGFATPPRPNLGFSRICASFALYVPCPSSGNVVNTSKSGSTITTEMPNNYSTAIPQNVTDFFQSGTKELGQSVSSIFDIQWRRYTTNTDVHNGIEDSGKKYLVGDYSQFASVLLNNNYELIEGLVLDTRRGSIGFRNHTIPRNAKYGAVWTEDLLFVQPETACVDTNLTLDFTIPLDSAPASDVSNLVLVDHGGFTNINHTVPQYNSSTAQADPELAYRAYQGAWMNNAYTALYLNVTNPGPAISGMKSFSYLNSSLGKRFPMQMSKTTQRSTFFYRSFQVSSFGSYLDTPSSFTNSNKTFLNQTTQFELNIPTNPWDIVSENFTDIQKLCMGALSGSRANITNVAGVCGLVMGVAQPKGQSSPILFEPGTDWTIPMYTCASAARAMIKTVTFRYNGTSLKDLSIESIEDKKYNSSGAFPNWAVEKSDMRLSAGSPLWGLVSREQRQDVANMSFLQAPHLWLPGALGSPLVGMPVAGFQNLPGVNFFQNAFSVAYTSSATSTPSDTQDYTGKGNLPLYNKWAELSSSANTTARIINLIWTDVAANAVVGTKGWLPSASGLDKRTDAPQRVFVPVTPYTRRVRYDLRYGIPAFIVLVIVAASLLVGLVLAILQRATPSRLQNYITRTSTGRVMTALLHGDEHTAALPSKAWIHRAGSTKIDISGPVPRGEHYDPGFGAAKRGSESFDPILSKDGTVVGLQELNSRSQQSQQRYPGRE